jgi:hypothetical protein
MILCKILLELVKGDIIDKIQKKKNTRSTKLHHWIKHANKTVRKFQKAINNVNIHRY